MNRLRRSDVCLRIPQHTDVLRYLLEEKREHVGVADGLWTWRPGAARHSTGTVRRSADGGDPGTAVKEGAAGIHRDAGYTTPDAIGQGSRGGGGGGDGKAHRQAQGRSQGDATGQDDAGAAAGNAERRPGA